MAENNQKSEWYNVKQNHSFGYSAMLVMLKICPPVVMRFLAMPIGFFYWLFGKSTRKVSANYLKNVNEVLKAQSKPLCRSSLKHIVSFALNLVENVQTWAGKFTFKDIQTQDDDLQDLYKNIREGRGCVIMISHLGNAQMLKGLAAAGESGINKKLDVTTIFDTEISSGLNSLLNQINPEAGLNLINSNDIGPETIFIMQERLEKGGLVVVAGDRVGAFSDRKLTVSFMDKEAEIPYGAFLLVSLLNAPAYFLNGLRKNDFSMNPRYDMYVKKNTVDFNCGRKERELRIKETAENYIKNLERLCLMHPYQWYNFFDFWK